MFVQIIGKGVVGSATGKILEKLGHQVTYYDVDGDVSDTEEPVEADLHFVCVPEDVVPESINNLSKAIDAESEERNPVVIRSTVPPTATEAVNTNIPGVCVHHMPEFLRESNAELDEWNPELLVVGSPNDGCCHGHVDMIKDIYSVMGEVYEMDSTASELLKLSVNGFFSTMISYWNQINLVASKLGVNSHHIAAVARNMDRVPNYGTLHGEPFGGKCLPKDLEQLIGIAKESGSESTLLESVKEINKEISNE